MSEIILRPTIVLWSAASPIMMRTHETNVLAQNGHFEQKGHGYE